MADRMLDKALARMPHSGPMRLIETIVSEDPARVVCVARDHRAPDYPLRIGGILHGATLLEIGAQAAAVHASLRSVGTAHTGLVLSVSNLVVARDRVETDRPLTASAELVQSLEGAASYRFAVLDGNETVVSGDLLLSMREDAE